MSWLSYLVLQGDSFGRENVKNINKTSGISTTLDQSDGTVENVGYHFVVALGDLLHFT